MIHGIKYLIVSLVFSHLGFWSGNLFLIAPFPDLCLLVPFNWLTICFLSISTYLSIIPTSVFGVGTSFRFRLFLIIAYLYFFLIFRKTNMCVNCFRKHAKYLPLSRSLCPKMHSITGTVSIPYSSGCSESIGCVWNMHFIFGHFS